MLRRLRVLVVVVSLTSTVLPSWAFLPPTHQDDGSIPLAADGQAEETALPPAQQDKASAWNQFVEGNPRWAATWNARTATPHRAYGQGIAVTGPVTSADQASEAALRFLREVAPFTKAADADLDVTASLRAGRVWYVHFRQRHEGVQILGDDISVRLGEDGRVFAFAADIRTGIALDTRPRLSARSAREAALEGLRFDANADRVHGGDQLWILPLDGEAGQTRYALVRQVGVTQQDPPHEWVTMVDAHTGELVWRFDRVRYAAVDGAITADVHELNPTDSFTEVGLRNVYAKVDGVNVTTDALGAYLAENAADGEVTLEFQLAGPWGKADRDDGPASAFFSTTLDASQAATFDHKWDNTISHPSERDGFRNAERTHEWIKGIDPDFTTIDYQMPIRVLLDGTCNAFWNTQGINFFKGGGGCRNTAMMADVVAHEYGHGINDKLYQLAGSPNGMLSSALHEGMADVTGAFLFDDPIIGEDFRTDGALALRNIDNTNTLPYDLVGEGHSDGQIIAGAFWDLREALGLAEASRLAHFAKYGLPDSPTSQRQAFREVLLEVLIVDDDDSDLSNGTPHWNEIIESFARHGIDRSLYVVIDHAGSDDPPTSESVLVTASIFSHEPLSFPLDDASVRLLYGVDGGDFQELAMEHASGASYSAEIPAQPLGSVVRYYFEATVVGGEVQRVPFDPTSRTFDYLVGTPQTLFADDFETDQGWTVGDEIDTAITGIWERADPQLTDRGSQPGNDHSRIGKLCYVTGNDHQLDTDPTQFPSGQDDVDGGATTLYSPVFDLDGDGVKVVRYYRLFDNNLGRAPATPLPDDPWLVQITNDGITWVDVENTLTSNIPSGRAVLTGQNDWQRVTFRVDRFLPPTDHVQLRFVASDTGTPSLVEALLDDVEILSIPTTSVPVLVSNFWLRQDPQAITLEWTAPVESGATFRLTARREGIDWAVGFAQPEPGRYVASDPRGTAASGAVTYSLYTRESEQAWTLVREETVRVQASPVPLALHAPRPNPFNPRTVVAFSLDREQRVKLTVVDVAGRVVKTLAEGSFTAGTHEANWRGDDEAGRRVASGVYFVTMQAERFTRSRKLVLLQ